VHPVGFYCTDMSRCMVQQNIKSYAIKGFYHLSFYFVPILVHVGFVVNNLAFGGILFRVPPCTLVTIIPLMTHTHTHLVFWVSYGSRNRNRNY